LAIWGVSCCTKVHRDEDRRSGLFWHSKRLSGRVKASRIRMPKTKFCSPYSSSTSRFGQPGKAYLTRGKTLPNRAGHLQALAAYNVAARLAAHPQRRRHTRAVSKRAGHNFLLPPVENRCAMLCAAAGILEGFGGRPCLNSSTAILSRRSVMQSFGEGQCCKNWVKESDRLQVIPELNLGRRCSNGGTSNPRSLIAPSVGICGSRFRIGTPCRRRYDRARRWPKRIRH
jgi:hypothetical protein